MLNLSFNFIKVIKKKLFPFYKNKELKLIFKKLHQGHQKKTVVARFVGGCVRKHIVGDNIDDIDVATILTTDEIKKIFQDTNFKIIETGVDHGTVTLLTKKFKIEFTTLRRDIRTDGRHAEVEYINDWKMDSERRDFTINAIYLDINGKIFDPQMGTIDLKNNNVKFIGDPQKRIEEDYLRIVRFIRFKIMYNSKVEPTTNNAIKLNLDGIKNISKERILSELFKILDLKNFLSLNNDKYLKDIFSLIFPEFLYIDRLEKLKKLLSYSKINQNIVLAALLIDEKNNHEYFSHKYNVSNKIKEDLNLFARNLRSLKENKNFFTKDLEKNIYHNGKDHVITLNILNYATNNKYKLSSFYDNLRKILQTKIRKFPISGKYLMQHGLQEGLVLGKVLKNVEKEWIENKFEISNKRVLEIIKKNTN